MRLAVSVGECEGSKEERTFASYRTLLSLPKCADLFSKYIEQTGRTCHKIKHKVPLFLVFLAIQDSSIGDTVSQSVTQSLSDSSFDFSVFRALVDTSRH